MKPAGQDREISRDTAAARIQPFPPSSISAAFSETFQVISEAGKNQLSEAEILAVITGIDTLVSEIDLFLSDTVLNEFAGMGIRELDHIRQKTDLYLERVNGLNKKLSATTQKIEDAAILLRRFRQQWELTSKNLGEEEITATRVERIERITQQIDSVHALLAGDLDILLSQQDRLAEKRSGLEGIGTRIREQRSLLGENLLNREAPGFIKELSSLKDSTLVSSHLLQLKKTVQSDIVSFRTRFILPVILINVFFLLFLVFSLWYKKNFARMISVERFELSEVHMTVVYSPALAVLFIAALLVRMAFPDFPQTFRSVNLILLMIPMLVLVIRLFGSLARTWMTALVAIFCLTFIYELIYYPSILLRIILMLFSISALLLFLWMILKKPMADRFRKTFLYQLYRIILTGFSLLLFAAVIANLMGAVRLAEFLTLIPIQTAVLAIGILLATRVVDTVLFLLLASKTVQKLNVFREEFQTIYLKSVRLVNLLLWVFFLVNVLKIFRVKTAFLEWGERVLNNGWKIGEVTISPGSILIFVFVIWLSIVVTRMVRHILEKDVFVRISTSRGTPSTVVLLVRIALISGGFLLAARAAGMKMTNLSIVLGAFSVGIGFGLHNIFNNMVSGLILAFERPIKVGDTVQVGELLGVVLSIGLRSSTVRSFDGAEVIVPNGNLISDQMINWTLSDTHRRMDLRVGVAYGTDPEKVIGLMEEVASTHGKVARKPPPKAYFLGFGESSLDFRLLAWTDIEYRLEVESELNVAINTSLKEAGIEIPFPQRDLHIRSDATRKEK